MNNVEANTETAATAPDIQPKSKEAKKSTKSKKQKTATSKRERTNPAAGKKAAKAATKRATKSAKAETKPAEARDGSKKNIILQLLRRKEGATIADIAKTTEWQNHSIRGFISGTITKKMGLLVKSSRNQSGDRTYRIDI
jgi:hypothetical protein